MQGENELEEDLLDQVQSCLGAVLEQFGDAAMALLEGLMPQISLLLTPSSSTEEKRVGICVMDDILEHSEQGRHPSACCCCLHCLSWQTSKTGFTCNWNIASAISKIHACTHEAAMM